MGPIPDWLSGTCAQPPAVSCMELGEPAQNVSPALPPTSDWLPVAAEGERSGESRGPHHMDLDHPKPSQNSWGRLHGGGFPPFLAAWPSVASIHSPTPCWLSVARGRGESRGPHHTTLPPVLAESGGGDLHGRGFSSFLIAWPAWPVWLLSSVLPSHQLSVVKGRGERVAGVSISPPSSAH